MIHSSKKRIAVLGITGFIGRSFEKFVSQSRLPENYQFFGLGRELGRAAHTGFFQYFSAPDFTANSLAQFVTTTDPHRILNCVGKFKDSSDADLHHVNVGVTQMLFDNLLASNRSVEKIVLLGSAAEYGRPQHIPIRECDSTNPINSYGWTKLQQTQLAQDYHARYNLPVVVARTFNILGEGQSHHLAIGSFAEKIRAIVSQGVISVGNIDVERDYLHPHDVAKHLWQLLEHGQSGQVYNVCSGKPMSMRQVLVEMIQASGKEIQIHSAAPSGNDIPSIVGNASKLMSLYR